MFKKKLGTDQYIENTLVFSFHIYFFQKKELTECPQIILGQYITVQIIVVGHSWMYTRPFFFVYQKTTFEIFTLSEC